MPQLGLLPIGVDPQSGLWEFAHLPTGDPPGRGPDGRLELKESMGVVLILIPGGKFWMGAQKDDPTGRHYDPAAQGDEGPPHELTLSPYFVSKYEMTQGQWKRVTGRNPSQYGPDGEFGNEWNRTSPTASLLHPVERVSWVDGKRILSRIGLVLPTEAQWEHGARAGTDTYWWSGDLSTLSGGANVADAWCKAHGGSPSWRFEIGLDDGFTVHAPVGSLRANAFGLHDVHGNVQEWCRDGYGGYSAEIADGDCERVVRGPRDRVNRGGNWNDVAAHARSSNRSRNGPEDANDYLGLRPARGITPFPFTSSPEQPERR